MIQNEAFDSGLHKPRPAGGRNQRWELVVLGLRSSGGGSAAVRSHYDWKIKVRPKKKEKKEQRQNIIGKQTSIFAKNIHKMS